MSPSAYPDGLEIFHGLQGDRRADYGPMTDLELLLAYRSVAMPAGGLRRLLAMGVPLDFLLTMLRRYEIAVSRVSMARSGLFDLDAGEAHLLVAVREDGEIIDICAFKTSAPDEWGLWNGQGWALGHEHYAKARDGLANRVCIFATPMDWLRAGGKGLCVLEWDAVALGALRGLGADVTLECPDIGAAERLKQLLAWDGLPRCVASPKEGKIAA